MAAACVFLILYSDYRISSFSKNCYNDPADIPGKKIGLLLGTSKYLSKGKHNFYYKYRIDAAVELFRLGKISYILVSGDNATMNYDEPTTIKKDLVNRGIPEKRIFLDYAGFRTLDSVERCKEVFGETDIVVISQQFHNERALYIAKKKGINAVGFNARDVDFRYGYKTKLREKFARVKTILDIHLLNTQPKFLGPKIEISEQQ